MPSLTLKDIPDELLGRLRAAAVRDRRSIAQEILVFVEHGLDATAPAAERAERQVSAWRSLAGSWRSAESFDDEVAAIRGARLSRPDVDL